MCQIREISILCMGVLQNQVWESQLLYMFGFMCSSFGGCVFVPRSVLHAVGWEGGSWRSRLVTPMCLSPEAAVL